MRAVIQRVANASVKVDGLITGEIGTGLLVLLGIEHNDTDKDVYWLVQKIAGMRIFNDDSGLMNRSVIDVGGQVLLVSQFTLFAQTKKGNRPGFTRAARPDIAIPLYELMKTELEKMVGKRTESGIFGADMKVSLLNDGPVTIMMDTTDKDNF